MPTRTDKHTISVTQDTKNQLDAYKNRTHNSYEDLIRDLIAYFEKTYSEDDEE